MKMKPWMLSGVVAVLVAVLAGCAGPKVSVSAPAGTGEKRIAMEASSFSFEPNEILAHSGDRLLLEVENTAGMDHNLTVLDPAGEVLLSRHLPAGQKVPIELNLEQPGDYPFYCDKPLHPSFGMKGTIRAQ
jgi:plastocyanin